MPRTSQQIESDQKLADAVEATRLAYADDIDEDKEGIIYQFVVSYAVRYWNDDGDPMTAVGRLTCQPPPSVHEQLGLLTYAAARMHAIASGVLESHDDDDSD